MVFNSFSIYDYRWYYKFFMVTNKLSWKWLKDFNSDSMMNHTNFGPCTNESSSWSYYQKPRTLRVKLNKKSSDIIFTKLFCNHRWLNIIYNLITEWVEYSSACINTHEKLQCILIVYHYSNKYESWNNGIFIDILQSIIIAKNELIMQLCTKNYFD